MGSPTMSLDLILADLERSKSRSPTVKVRVKVKSDDAIGLLIYGFLLMFNGNIEPN